MKRVTMTAVLLCGFALLALTLNTTRGQAQGGSDESKIQQGFAIAPVPLTLRGKNRSLVGVSESDPACRARQLLWSCSVILSWNWLE